MSDGIINLVSDFDSDISSVVRMRVPLIIISLPLMMISWAKKLYPYLMILIHKGYLGTPLLRKLFHSTLSNLFNNDGE